MTTRSSNYYCSPIDNIANLTQCHYNCNDRGHYQTGRNNNYHGYAPTLSNTNMPPLNNPTIFQYCEKPGHSPKQCYKIHGYPNKPCHPTAHVAQQVVSHSSSPSWLFDYGASHHITNDMSNLSIKKITMELIIFKLQMVINFLLLILVQQLFPLLVLL